MVSKKTHNNQPQILLIRDPVSSQIVQEISRLKDIKNDITTKISSLETLLHRHLTNNNNSSITDLPFPFVSRELPYASQHILIKIPSGSTGSKHRRKEGPQLKNHHERKIRKKQKRKAKKADKPRQADKLCHLLKALELKDKQNEQQEQIPSQNMKGSQTKINHDIKMEGSPHKAEDKKPQIGDNFFLF